MAVPLVVAIGAIVLIVVGSRFVLIAGILLLGLALSVALIKRFPRPGVGRRDDDEHQR